MVIPLRIVAGAIVIFIGIHYAMFSYMNPQAFIAVAVLIALSFAAVRWPRSIAIVSIVLSVLIPYGAVTSFFQGNLEWIVPVFDVAIFAYLFFASIRFLRNGAAATA